MKKSNANQAAKTMAKQKQVHEDRVNKKVNEKIFPFIKDNSTDVEDAKMFPAVMKVAIQQVMFNKTTKMLLKELNLAEELKGMPEKDFKKFREFIELMESESIADAYKILDGLVDEITQKERLLMKKTSLTDLYETA